MTNRQLVIAASLTLLVGVAAGAFGAHAMRSHLEPDMMAVWQTAVLYQLVHGLGMLAIATLGTRMPSPALSYAGTLMLVGVIIFSGSLYVLSATGVRSLGAITPIGGLAFIAAWAMVAFAAYRSTR